jgi:hypothetical protein
MAGEWLRIVRQVRVQGCGNARCARVAEPWAVFSASRRGSPFPDTDCIITGSHMACRVRQQAKGECDVRLVGRVVKQAPWHQRKNRPRRIGGCIGHFRVTAGTLGAFVTLRASGGDEDWILSNNHVLADVDTDLAEGVCVNS